MIAEEARWEIIASLRESELTLTRLRIGANGVTKTRGQSPVQGVKRFTVRPGETIQSAAKKNQCPESDIIRLNRLRFPFIDGSTATPAEGIAVRNAQILVPATGGQARAPVEATSQQSSSDALYYVGVQQIEKEPGKYDLAVSGGDVVPLDGPDNALQDINNMLLCKQGWNQDHEWHGAPGLQGEPVDENALKLYESKLRGSIKRDPRIVRVTELRLRFENQALLSKIKLQLVGARTTTTDGAAVRQ